LVGVKKTPKKLSTGLEGKKVAVLARETRGHDGQSALSEEWNAKNGEKIEASGGARGKLSGKGKERAHATPGEAPERGGAKNGIDKAKGGRKVHKRKVP